jgi:hypothetical protein
VKRAPVGRPTLPALGSWEKKPAGKKLIPEADLQRSGGKRGVPPIVRPHSVRHVILHRAWRLGLAALASVLLAGAAAAQAPEQVQYLPRDGAAIVLWNPVPNATGYNVWQQEVESPTSDTLTLKKVNPEPVTTTSLMVENLTNGKSYHFRVSAIVGGTESDPVGPAVAQGDQGDFVAVVPQKPVKLAGRPEDFYGHNIGTDYPGSHTVSETGTITMKASGWDIQSEADGFYFLAAPIKGDVTMTVRVVSGPTETANESTWNLSGLQIRESLDAQARFAMQQVASNGPIQFKRRTEFAQGPPDTPEADGDPTRRPVFLKLERKGDDFSGFVSDDGTNWTQIGETVNIADFPDEAYAGLGHSSHDDGEYSEVVFDQLTITQPAPPPAE